MPGRAAPRVRDRTAEKVRSELADLPGDELRRLILTLEEEMHEAAADLRFEYAARLRDEIKDLKRELREVGLTRSGDRRSRGLAMPLPTPSAL